MQGRVHPLRNRPGDDATTSRSRTTRAFAANRAGRARASIGRFPAANRAAIRQRGDSKGDAREMRNTVGSIVLVLATTACSSMDGDRAMEWNDFGSDPMSNPAFMEAMMAAATPGAEHAELAKGVGSFDVKGRMWDMAGVEGEPMTATAQTRMVMDGRFLVQDYQSSFGGFPFEGMMLMGYDNVAKEYWSVWIDSASTGCVMSRGRERADGRIDLKGTVRDAITPDGRPMRFVTWDRGDGTSVLEMYDSLEDGREAKVMELTYTKR